MNQIALIYVAMIFLFVSAVDADAKRFRFFAAPGFSRGETIDRIYDLPNQTTFVVEGKFFDLGYLNSSSGDAYVLYNGDQYVELDEVGLKGISSMLGFDPTVEDRKKRAAASEAAEPIGRLIGGFVLLVGLFVLPCAGVFPGTIGRVAETLVSSGKISRRSSNYRNPFRRPYVSNVRQLPRIIRPLSMRLHRRPEDQRPRQIARGWQSGRSDAGMPDAV